MPITFWYSEMQRLFQRYCNFCMFSALSNPRSCLRLHKCKVFPIRCVLFWSICNTFLCLFLKQQTVWTGRRRRAYPVIEYSSRHVHWQVLCRSLDEMPPSIKLKDRQIKAQDNYISCFIIRLVNNTYLLTIGLLRCYPTLYDAWIIGNNLRQELINELLSQNFNMTIINSFFTFGRDCFSLWQTWFNPWTWQ